jgi:hypothetical protein
MWVSQVAEHSVQGFENIGRTTLSDAACNVAREPCVARSRGLCQCFCMSDPGVPLRSTPGFTLPPASAGSEPCAFC